MAAKTDPTVELFYRLSDVLGAHNVHPDDRDAIQQAYLAAGGDEATWNDLPADIKAKIEEIEKTPRTSFEDPSDVPDELDE